MATALTLNQMLDEVRRYIRITPPIDPPVSSGTAGQQPAYTPDPNNNTIIQAINDGIFFVNRIVRVGIIQDLSASVTAVSASKRGAAWVDLSAAIAGGSGDTALIAAEIENVWWVPTGSNVSQQLEPLTYYKYVTGYRNLQQSAPSNNVSQFTVSGPQVGLIPPPAQAGTLNFTVTQGMAPLSSGTDTIPFLPVDLQQTILYWAVVILCARRANDVEGQSLLGPYLSMAQDGTLKIWQWKNGYDEEGLAAIRNQIRMSSLQALAAPQSASGGSGGS